jgi:hypothetical protein
MVMTNMNVRKEESKREVSIDTTRHNRLDLPPPPIIATLFGFE